MNALTLMYVGVGGAVGSMARYAVNVLCTRFLLIDFPVATFTVNILGGFLMGAWIATITFLLPAKAKELHLLVAVGFLGGFTTFSAFSLEIFLLFDRGLAVQTVLYIAGSVFFSVMALLAGMWVVRLFLV